MAELLADRRPNELAVWDPQKLGERQVFVNIQPAHRQPGTALAVSPDRAGAAPARRQPSHWLYLVRLNSLATKWIVPHFLMAGKLAVPLTCLAVRRAEMTMRIVRPRFAP